MGAQSRVLDDGGRFFRGADGTGAAMVDVGGVDPHALLARVGRVDDRLRHLREIAEAADLRLSDRIVRVGGDRHALVGRVVERATLRGWPTRQAPGATRTVLSLCTFD